MAKVIPVARANNVSIMLTQFSNFRKGPHDIRKALVTGTSLSLERLSLLLQVHIDLFLCFGLFICSFLPGDCQSSNKEDGRMGDEEQPPCGPFVQLTQHALIAQFAACSRHPCLHS